MHHIKKMKDKNHMNISIDAEKYLPNLISIYDKNFKVGIETITLKS